MTLRRLTLRRHPFTSGLVVAVMLPAIIVYFAKGGVT